MLRHANTQVWTSQESERATFGGKPCPTKVNQGGLWGKARIGIETFMREIGLTKGKGGTYHEAPRL